MPERPNFLIVMSDQHAADTIGGLGHPAVKTPSLDRLMGRAVTFTSAYCPYPMCTPSRASFMTGLLTPAHEVWELGTPLRTDLPTWAHALRRAGYLTSIAGRMHFVGFDVHHGFERRAHPELRPLRTPFVYADWDKPETDEHVMLEALRLAGPTAEPTPVELYDRAVTDAALAELDCLCAAPAARPWALMVGLVLPHFPYAIRRSLYDLYEGVRIPPPRPPPDGRPFEEHVPPQLQGSRRWLGLSTDGATPEQILMARRCYYAMVSCVDELVGRLIARLEELGKAADTWIVYTSDHGDNMGEHGFWSKCNFYEDSVRVPLIVAAPGIGSPGARCASPISLIDWLPTTLEATGQRGYCSPLPGRSLLPLLEHPEAIGDERTIIADYAGSGTRVPMRMVRRGRWKASFAQGFPPTLFDVAGDPGEWRDFGEDPAHADTVQRLYAHATADGWEPAAAREAVLLQKRRMIWISEAEASADTRKS